MLYDPRWEVKANPFSRQRLIGWLETMPTDKRYPAAMPGGCMLFQWLQSIDPEAWWIRADYLRNPFRYVVNGAVVDLVHFKYIAVGGKNTFGAALERARNV